MTRCCPQREGPIAFWSSSGVCVSLLPRRRRQPSGGSARAEPVFPTKGEVATEGVSPARHGGWGARATRRNSRRNSRDPRVATVYTNAPKQHRGAVFADLCTLLRSLTCPQRRNSVHECPKTAPRGRFRQSVYTPASPRPLARPGGVMGPTTSTALWLL